MAQSVNISEFKVTSANPAPYAITAGPDGALWFTENNGGIGRISTAGMITEFPLTNSGNLGITVGPDAALWFTQVSPSGLFGSIGRITTSGAVQQFPVPTSSSRPTDITAGPDDALWFTENGTSSIGRADTSGTITEYPIISQNRGPQSITAGPDGALWFTEGTGNGIGRITTAGAITEFLIRTPSAMPLGITTGPDGALWFAESGSYRIGRITTAGSITEFILPTTDAAPTGIVSGPDGALWFTESGPNVNRIGRITTAGAITTFALPGINSGIGGIKTGPDGALWFTETTGNRMGRAVIGSGLFSVSQIVSGGGWTTTITLMNTGGSSSQATVNFFDDNGNPLAVPLTFPQGAYSPATAATFTGAVNAGAELVIVSTAPSGQSAQVGCAQILTSGGVSGFAVINLATGGSVQEAVVPLESRTPGAFLLSFDNTAGYDTGVALANLSSVSGSIAVTVRDDTGAALTTGTIVLAPNGHMSFNLKTNYQATALRRGTVEFDTPSNGQISVLGLRFNPTGAFSTIPATAK